MDGAMGTELLRAGAKQPFAALNQAHSGAMVRAVHRAYVSAGAEVLVTNTFRPVPPPELVDTFQAAIRLAKSASPTAFVLADHGPEWNSVDVEACRGADGLLLETLSDSLLMEALARTDDKLPRLVSFTFARFSAGRIQTQQQLLPETCAEAALRCGSAALGVNCGRDIGLPELLEIIAGYRTVTDLPLFVRPNAGTPTQIDDRWVYPETPASMAAWLPALFEAGVVMVGGCCGTTPAHIAAFRKVVDSHGPPSVGLRGMRS